EVARACLAALGTQLLGLKEQIVEFDRLIMAWHPPTKRASAFIIFLGSVRYWRRLWPRASLTRRPSDQGATSRLGSGSYRSSTRVVARTGPAGSPNKAAGLYAGLSVPGALSVIRYAKIHGTKHRPWLTALLARRPTKVAAIALANKLARMAWAMMSKGERYREPAALAA